MASIRLTAYLQHVRSPLPPSPQRWEHKTALWNSILQALGFRKGFRRWWIEGRTSQAYGEPRELPTCPPGHDEAQTVHAAFQSEVEALESALTAKRREKLAQSHQEDSNRIFKDLQSEPSRPVQSLVQSQQLQVKTVTGNPNGTTSVELEMPPARPLRGNATTLTVETRDQEGEVEVQVLQLIKGDGCQLTVKGPEICEASHIKCETAIGHVSEVKSAFSEEWVKRWDRHREVPHSAWEPVITFAKDAFQTVRSMEYEPISLDKWLSCLRAKKRRAAVGPDGVSREDLLSMPAQLHQCILDIIKKVEECPSTMWPPQLVQGHVVALEKVDGAPSFDGFRPITVLPLVYRVWSSIRCRQILRHLSQYADKECVGNLPGKHTAHVWWTIQEALDMGMTWEKVCRERSWTL